MFLSVFNINIKVPLFVTRHNAWQERVMLRRAKQCRSIIEAEMITLWFFLLLLNAYDTHTLNFCTLPIEYRCHTIVGWSQSIKSANTRVDWWGLSWIKVFKWVSLKLVFSWMWRVIHVKNATSETGKHFCAILSPIAFSPYMAQMVLTASNVLFHG